MQPVSSVGIDWKRSVQSLLIFSELKLLNGTSCRSHPVSVHHHQGRPEALPQEVRRAVFPRHHPNLLQVLLRFQRPLVQAWFGTLAELWTNTYVLFSVLQFGLQRGGEAFGGGRSHDSRRAARTHQVLRVQVSDAEGPEVVATSCLSICQGTWN